MGDIERIVYIRHPANGRYFEIRQPKDISTLVGNMVNVITEDGFSYVTHETNILIITKPKKEVSDENGNS